MSMTTTITIRARFVIAAALAAALAAPSGGVWAQAAARVLPDPAVLELAAGPAEPDAGALLRAGLLFSGATPARTERAAAAARALMEEAAAMAAAEPDAWRLGEALLGLLHDRWLKRYVEAETTLDAAILDGRYNCVSASVAYLVLAKAAGLEAGGVITRDHAFCYVTAGGVAVDVETTNRHGWDPGTKKEFLDSFGRVTGYSYVPPSDYRNRDSVGGRHVAALILWNRSTLLERASRWAEALALSADAYAWLGTDEARRHLAERAHNYAALFINTRRWDEALELFGRLESAYGELGDIPLLARQAAVGRLADRLPGLESAEALAGIAEAMDSGLLSEEDRRSMYGYVLSRQAAAVAASDGWLAAWRLLQGASDAEPDFGELAKLAANARANYVAETHNRFAALYNARRFAEALAIMQEALLVLPGDRTFLKDAELAGKAIAQGG